MTVPRTPFTRADVEVLEVRHEWKGFFELRSLRLRHRLFAGGWGSEVRRELFVRGAAVGVLLYDARTDQVGLVEQFRVGALGRSQNPWLLELVAGIIEDGEGPEDVAYRETTEETGGVLRALELIAGYYSSPGGSDEYFHLFCGDCDLSAVGGVHGLAEEGEDIRVVVLSFDDALALAESGEIDNAHSLVALFWLYRHRNRLRKAWASHYSP